MNYNGIPFRFQQAWNIGQIVFALCIVIFDSLEGGKEFWGIEAVDAGVHFFYLKFFIVRILLLDDSTEDPVSVSDHSAVSSRIFDSHTQNGAGGTDFSMVLMLP